MGLQYRRRVGLGRGSWINVSKSGASVSHRSGPVTVNSRGGMSLRLLPGLSYRRRGSSAGGVGGLVGLAVWLVVMSFWAMFAVCWLVVRLSWLLVVVCVHGAVRLVRAVQARRTQTRQVT